MKDQLELEELIGARIREARLDPRGREIPDPVPVAPPVGYKRQPSLAEQIRAMVRSEKLRDEAQAAGYETFEEADDFDVGDDYEPNSPYEVDFDPTPVSELRRRAAADVQDGDPASPATPRQGAPQAPASGGGEAGLDGPDTP